MLGAEFVVEFVLDLGEMGVGLAGNGNCFCLVLGGVHFNEVLEGIVVNVVYAREGRVSNDESTNVRSIVDIRRLHSGTDSLSKFWPYFIALSSGRTMRRASPNFWVGPDTGGEHEKESVDWSGQLCS